MVVFKSSVTRFPKSQCAIALLYFLWRVDKYSGLCLGRSRLSIPYPWRLDFILPLLFFKHWPFCNSDSSVSVFAGWQCGSHCVFSVFVRVAPLGQHITLVYTLAACLLRVKTLFL